MNNYLTERTIFLFILLCIIGFTAYQSYQKRNHTPVIFEDAVAASSSNVDELAGCKKCIKDKTTSTRYECIKYGKWCAHMPGAIVNEAAGRCQYGHLRWSAVERYTDTNGNDAFRCRGGGGWNHAPVPAPPPPPLDCPYATNPNTHPIITSFCPLVTTNNIPNGDKGWQTCKVLERNNGSPLKIWPYAAVKVSNDEYQITGPYKPGKYKFTNCQIERVEINIPTEKVKTSEIQWCNMKYYYGTKMGCDPMSGDSLTLICDPNFQSDWRPIATNSDRKYAIWC